MQTPQVASTVMASPGNPFSGRVQFSHPPSGPFPADRPTRPVQTLTSSLDIPVEGVLPIPKSSLTTSTIDDDSVPITPINEPEGRRAPRKSKTDALAALQTRSVSPFPGSGRETSVSMGIDDPRPSVFDDIPCTPILTARALDMQTVKTKGLRVSSISMPTRPFGLEDCPTFYPSLTEFSDPLTYIRSIADRAQQYGICKVVPPESWNMPFATNTEVSVAVCHRKLLQLA